MYWHVGAELGMVSYYPVMDAEAHLSRSSLFPRRGSFAKDTGLASERKLKF